MISKNSQRVAPLEIADLAPPASGPRALSERSRAEWEADRADRPQSLIRGPVPGRSGAIPDSAPIALVLVAEAFAYSSTLAAAIGGALTYAVGLALSAPESSRTAALVACATYFIYNVDRLRDVERDRATSPSRTSFVEQNRRLLTLASGLAAIVLAALLAAAPARVVALCVAIGTVGFLHRRLKQDVLSKVAYVSCAWTAACFGIPWLMGGAEADRRAAFALAFVATSIVANVIASNLRVGKWDRSRESRANLLAIACGLAIGVVPLAALAPDGVAPLAWIPAAQAAALYFYRDSERFAQLAVDGLLAFGAALAILWSGVFR